MDYLLEYPHPSLQTYENFVAFVKEVLEVRNAWNQISSSFVIQVEVEEEQQKNEKQEPKQEEKEEEERAMDKHAKKEIGEDFYTKNYGGVEQLQEWMSSTINSMYFLLLFLLHCFQNLI